jgi:hypothetical protein
MVYAIPVGSPQDLEARLEQSFAQAALRAPRQPTMRLVGLLFAPVGAPLTTSAVIPRLDQYHWRSGAAMDLFCPGYAQADAPGAQADATFATVLEKGPDGVAWHFSHRRFDEVRSYVEDLSGWRNSGEVDLLLVMGRKEPDQVALKLDWRSGIVIALDNAISDKAIRSVATFMEQLFRYADQHPVTPRVGGFVVATGGKVVAESLLDILLGALPIDLRALWKKGRHFQPLALA